MADVQQEVCTPAATQAPPGPNSPGPNSGPTRNVCGEVWWLHYYKNLTEEDKAKVKQEDGYKKKFKFGGGGC